MVLRWSHWIYAILVGEGGTAAGGREETRNTVMCDSVTGIGSYCVPAPTLSSCQLAAVPSCHLELVKVRRKRATLCAIV